MQRVYDYLATFTFERTVNASAQVSLGRELYWIGKKLVRDYEVQTVTVQFEAIQREWVFEIEGREESVRRLPKGLDVQFLTGLDPKDCQPLESVQLTLPFLIA